MAILDGAEGGRRVEVAGQLIVGRGGDAGLVIEDPEISRAHAVLASTGEGLEIEDLGSLNGTWVNGERITGAMHLAPGDVIKVGTTRVEVLSVSEDQVVPDAKFGDDLDADSLDLVELVMALEEEFHIEVPEDELEGIETVLQAYNLVEGKLA